MSRNYQGSNDFRRDEQTDPVALSRKEAAYAKMLQKMHDEDKRPRFLVPSEINKKGPDLLEVDMLLAGDRVKLVVLIKPTKFLGGITVIQERFWVELETIVEDWYVGRVTSKMVASDSHGIKEGDNLQFVREQVFEISCHGPKGELESIKKEEEEDGEMQ